MKKAIVVLFDLPAIIDFVNDSGGTC